MYLHIVMMKFDPAPDPAFIAQVQAHCQRVREECGGLVSYDFRTNEASRSDGLDYATVSLFTDAAAHDAYQVSAAHVAMKADMLPRIQRLAVFDGTLESALKQ
ncbi:Dabb family protein [Pigmentiphaga aceris]|uniref:Dabb family protein n=1 Tax=Pigmentiphaga aceris TaxID=1940612 RepID=A0A5C0B5K6_9BURK|nr:Dabb family protein [Pigmentiphaga aceris]QEI09414.1 Dabb family protein [Pigmentiphaga aceris]